jgi:hypothetical protein
MRSVSGAPSFSPITEVGFGAANWPLHLILLTPGDKSNWCLRSIIMKGKSLEVLRVTAPHATGIFGEGPVVSEFDAEIGFSMTQVVLKTSQR